MTYTTITPQRWQRLLLFAGLVAALGVEECNLNLVSIESPADGTTFTEAQTVTITATALEGEGLTVEQVRFYRDDVLVGSDRFAPYTHSWPITEADNGTHRFYAGAMYRRNDGTTELLQSEEVTYEVAIGPPVPNPDPVPGRVELTGFETINDIAIDAANGIALVTSDSTGLSIIDVSDPSRPRVVGHLNLPHRAMGVAIDGSFAYVMQLPAFENNDAPRVSILTAIDLRSFTNPIVVGQLTLPGNAGALVVEDSVAYAGTGTGLHFVDVSNPRAPRLLSQLETGLYVVSVSLSGERLFIKDVENIVTIDVRNPRSPRVLGELSTAWSRAILVGDLVFAIDKSSLWIVDNSSPPRWQLLGKILVQPKNLDVDGDRVFVSTASGVLGIDITNPRAPEVVEEISTGKRMGAIEANGSLVLAGDQYGTLHVIVSAGGAS